MFINKKIMQLVVSYLADYNVDIMRKVLELKENSELKDALKLKQFEVLQISIYLTNKMYRPKMRKTK